MLQSRSVLFQTLSQQALAIQRGGIHIQVLADGLCNGAKAQPSAQIHPLLYPLAADQQGHILPGVVGGLGVGRSRPL